MEGKYSSLVQSPWFLVESKFEPSGLNYFPLERQLESAGGFRVRGFLLADRKAPERVTGAFKEQFAETSSRLQFPTPSGSLSLEISSCRPAIIVAVKTRDQNNYLAYITPIRGRQTWITRKFSAIIRGRHLDFVSLNHNFKLKMERGLVYYLWRKDWLDLTFVIYFKIWPYIDNYIILVS